MFYSFASFFGREINEPCKLLIDDCGSGLTCRVLASCILFTYGKSTMCCRPRRRYGK